MFSYINKDMDLRNNGIQINLWLRNLKLCFFLLLSRKRIERFQSALFSKKGSWPKSDNASYFQQSCLVFEMLSLNTFIGIVQWLSFFGHVLHMNSSTPRDKTLEYVLKRRRGFDCVVHTFFTDWYNWSGHASQPWLIFQNSSDSSNMESKLRTSGLEQGFQNFNVHVNHQDTFLKHDSDLIGIDWILKVYISTKLLEDTLPAFHVLYIV